MQQWEYRIDMIPSVSISKNSLDSVGQFGWELVNIYREDGFYYAVFKRPKV